MVDVGNLESSIGEPAAWRGLGEPAGSRPAVGRLGLGGAWGRRTGRGGDGDWDERGRWICREAMGGEVVGKLPVCPRMNVVQVEIHGYCCQFIWEFSFRIARLGWAAAQF
jgi:hypothetical protein